MNEPASNPIWSFLGRALGAVVTELTYLGNAAEECDIALLVRQRIEPSYYAVHQILGENDAVDEVPPVGAVGGPLRVLAALEWTT